MVTIIDHQAPTGLLATAGVLKMPFSDAVKYSILALSIILLLLALAILAWQIFRYFTQTHNTYSHQDTGEKSLYYMFIECSIKYSAEV